MQACIRSSLQSEQQANSTAIISVNGDKLVDHNAAVQGLGFTR